MDRSSTPAPLHVLRTAAGSRLLLLVLAGWAALPVPSRAQDAPDARAAPPAERATYTNARDGTVLSGTLTLPPAAGPAPGVVVLSIAGADALVKHLTSRGHAVLVHERRGMSNVERLLQADYGDLAGDALAALEFLRSRPEVDASAVSLLGQGEDAPAALLAAVDAVPPAPLVLLSSSGLPGREAFTIEQLALAVERGFGPDALDALGEHLDRVATAALGEGTPAAREARLRSVMATPGVELPRSAAFPREVEGQARFLASPWWWSRLSFRPDVPLERLGAPVLVVMGEEDAFAPWQRHVPAIRASLEAAPTRDATVCLLPGRVRHAFTPVALSVVGDWLGERAAAAGSPAGAESAPHEACLDEDRAR